MFVSAVISEKLRHTDRQTERIALYSVDVILVQRICQSLFDFPTSCVLASFNQIVGIEVPSGWVL